MSRFVQEFGRTVQIYQLDGTKNKTFESILVFEPRIYGRL
jgi:hypothetical protein